MDGYIANLQGICDLADEFDALVMVDDSHAASVEAVSSSRVFSVAAQMAGATVLEKR